MSLAELLARGEVWRGGDLARSAQPVVATGFPDLDAELPGGGWPCGALTEVLQGSWGFGEFSLLLPLLAQQSRRHGVALVNPPWLPYAPALAQAGVCLERLVILAQAKPTLSLVEELLRSDGFALVLAWHAGLPASTSLRRLQVVQEGRHSLLLLMGSAHWAERASPAPLRLLLQPLPDATGGLGLRILKRRGAPASRLLSLPLRRPGRASHALSRPVLSPAATGSPALLPLT